MRSFAEIADDTKSDKEFRHHYGPYYEGWFYGVRESISTVLEIGVQFGDSLRIWEEFFPNARIIGIDIDPNAKQYESERSKVLIGNQASQEIMDAAKEFIGGTFDVIIDDGGHRSPEQIASIHYLKNAVTPGGSYVVEDLATSLDPEFGGRQDLVGTCVEYLADDLAKIAAGSSPDWMCGMVAPEIVFLRRG